LVVSSQCFAIAGVTSILSRVGLGALKSEAKLSVAAPPNAAGV